MAANKNSTYIGSLVSFLQDTKPYHCKITEVIEEYQFFDSMSVAITEKMFSTNIARAAWEYSFFSGGQSVPPPTMQVKRLTSPLFHGLNINSEADQENTGAFKVGRDECTDIMVPYAYDPRTMAEPGFSDAFVQRNGSRSTNEPLIEGLDVHQSHGAYVFQIKEVLSLQPIVTGRFDNIYNVTDGPFPFQVLLGFDSDVLIVLGPAVQIDLHTIAITGPGHVKATGFSTAPNYLPEFTERPNEDLLAWATAMTQIQALDVSNPTSAVNRISVIMDQIAAQLILTPNLPAQAALLTIQDTLAIPALPSTYSELLDALVAGSTPIITGFDAWIGDDAVPPFANRYVNKKLDEYSPSLYFNHFTDMNIREDGALGYNDVIRADLHLSNIQGDFTRENYEEFTVELLDTFGAFRVTGSSTGVIGTGVIGTPFNQPQLSFTSTAGTSAFAVNDVFYITPRAKITIHATAPLEAWSIIKVNPMAFTRPLVVAAHIGHLIDQDGDRGKITVLDPTFPVSTLTLFATSSTSFQLTSSVELTYTPVITVGVPFDDGRLAFTIVPGVPNTFSAGDKFFIEIVNPEPFAEDLDLYYGYDLDSYDADGLIANTLTLTDPDYQQKLGFDFDSRFVDYDVAAFGLHIEQTATDNLQWRLRAIADTSQPLKLQNTTPTNKVNEVATDDPLNPNPGAPQFDMPDNVTAEGPQSATDPDTATDIFLWYSNGFALEYFSAGTWHFVDTIALNTPYVNTTYGISFTIVPAPTPFIAGKVHSSWFPAISGSFLEEDIDGGDVIAWTVKNSPPVQDGHAELISQRVPRLIMHADSFYDCTPARFLAVFTDESSYTLEAYYTTGIFNGLPVTGYPVLVDMAQTGNSYHDVVNKVHFTFYAGGTSMAAGDTFTFETLDQAPSYLVYGSNSGWQPDAVLNKWYWNGKIGFKITSPVVEAYDEDMNRIAGDTSWTTDSGLISLQYIRPDAPSGTYVLSSHIDGHWMLQRESEVVGTGDTEISDRYMTLNTPSAINGSRVIFKVRGDRHNLSLGNHLAIVRTTPGKMPTADDFVLFERTATDNMQLAIQALDGTHELALEPLNRLNIDQRFVNINALSGVPLVNTSPETGLLQGWVPLVLERYDIGSSLAQFSDPTQKTVVRAAATGETIGTITSTGETLNDKVLFTWDSNFVDSYLPLNAQTNIVALGSSGMNENIQFKITDDVWFLLDGGGLDEDALFTEVATVSIVDSPVFNVRSTYGDSFSTSLADGPFGGFLPGYDNTRFDFETESGDLNNENGGGGAYDLGQSFTGYFDRAKELYAKSLHTPLSIAEQRELEDNESRIDAYTTGTGIADTTIGQFLTALNADLYNGTTTPGFGFPVIGLGISVETDVVADASTSITETMVFTVTDIGDPMDASGLDIHPMDARADSIAIMSVTALPPLAPGMPPLGMAYVDYDTLLVTPIEVLIVQLAFKDAPLVTPTVYVWVQGAVAPVLIQTVERVNPRLYKVALAAAAVVKVIVL
jgi:hypothetical protein